MCRQYTKGYFVKKKIKVLKIKMRSHSAVKLAKPDDGAFGVGVVRDASLRHRWQRSVQQKKNEPEFCI